MKAVATIVGVENRTLAEQVYQHIRTEILADGLSPGTELNEVALAEGLGVSRGPVREAMGRLRAEALVEVRPRRGTVVAGLSKQEFEEAYQVREALEVLAVRLTTPNADARLLRDLEHTLVRMRHCAEHDDEAGFFELNRAFHRAIVVASGNRALARIYEGLTMQMRRYTHRSATLRGDLITSVGEHEAILQAMRRGDAMYASTLMAEHISVPQRMVATLTADEWESLEANVSPPTR